MENLIWIGDYEFKIWQRGWGGDKSFEGVCQLMLSTGYLFVSTQWHESKETWIFARPIKR